jgi:hypothetical protein
LGGGVGVTPEMEKQAGYGYGWVINPYIYFLPLCFVVANAMIVSNGYLFQKGHRTGG